MANLISIPGFNLSVSYDREQIAEAAAQAVAGVAYRATKGAVSKGLITGEKAAHQGAVTRSAVDRGIAETTLATKRVAAASGRKAQRLIGEQVGQPIKAKIGQVRDRQIKAHDQIRAKLDLYCQDLDLQVATLALPEAKAEAVVPAPKKRRRTLSDVAIEAMAE